MMRGILGGLLLTAACGAAVAQVSPGALSKAHASLEGNSNCLRCHGTKREGGVDGQCIACHREIALLKTAGRGLHAREGAKNCASCHPEHGGRDFALIAWKAGEPSSFDHARAGSPLAGKHAKARCAACHEVLEKRVSPVVKLAPGPLRASSFLGLETECRACHADVHKGSLGTDCDRCHGAAQETFKISAFDHGKTTYPLTGKHAAVACAKCHVPPATAPDAAPSEPPVPRFKPLAHAECSECHKDPHAGRLGPACGRCHTTASFREVARDAFDHERTRYPLRGKHATVACAKCHQAPATPGGPMVKPAFAKCSDCHRDAHGGRATVAGVPADCSACHTVDGFRPSTFTIERHDRTPYPLAGAHARVACAKCHTKDLRPGTPWGTSGVVLRPARTRCEDCHADAHAGQLRERRGVTCDSCHTVERFKPSTYGASEHARVWALGGKHAKTACADCHRRNRPEKPLDVAKTGAARVDFHPGTACTVCHEDAHAGRFGQRSCADCHDAAAFRPSLYDAALHAKAAYPLDGAHVVVPCVGCHAELATAGSRRPVFRDARRRCAECHKDPHAGQFASRPGGGACETCHDTTSFRPARRFDHAKDARFRLEGAHARAACARCHKPAAGGGSNVVIYRATPRECAACHHAPSPGPAEDPR